MQRRDFLRTATAGASALAFLQTKTPAKLFTDPAGMPATVLAQLIREKKISSVEVVKAFLKRIDQVNPKLNAVVLVAAERALMEARNADALLSKGGTPGALHGVPMTIDDALDTAGIVSTAGTLGRRNYMPGRDAMVVDRLRKAGAILLGKTNTSELAVAGETDNLVYGRTFHPSDLSRNPGGSSGGAAVIVSAGGSPFGIGSDYGAGLRMPAHYCGAAALKPTAGRVPRTGHVVDCGGVFTEELQIGPVARRVDDLALIYSVISGFDYGDACSVPMPTAKPDDVNARALKAAFYTSNGGERPVEAETSDAVKRATEILRSAGIALKEDAPLELFKEAEEINGKLWGADGRSWVKRLLAKCGTKTTHPRLRLDGNVMTSADFTELVERRDACRSRLLQWMRNYDVLLCPVDRGPAPPLADPESGDKKDVSYTGVFSLTGWPVVVVRVGTSSSGLPVGIQVVARPWQEEVALAVGRIIESQPVTR